MGYWHLCKVPRCIPPLYKVVVCLCIQRGYGGCPTGGTGLYGWVSCTQRVSNGLSGPGETMVSKKGMDPLLLGSSIMN